MCASRKVPLWTATALRVAVLFAIVFPSTSYGQHSLTVSSDSALPGASVTLSVILNNPEPVNGFSLGVSHNAAVLTLDSIDPGSAVAASNSGSGADFFFTNPNAPNGPGGTIGCILSFSAPLDSIPIGSNNEVVRLNYTVAASAVPGTTSTSTLTDTIGTPPVELIVDVGGSSQIPATINGGVSILTPAVSNFGCVLADPCACIFNASWSNPATPYDAIQILQDGVVVQTLAGTATSASINTGAFGTYTFGVVGIRNSQNSEATECIGDCPVIDVPSIPTGLTCTVDHDLCQATLTWSNSGSYDSIDIFINGAMATTLAGGSTSTVTTLPGVGVHTLGVAGFNICGDRSVQAECSAECLQSFRRGDTNQDGLYNISDAVTQLNYFFGSATSTCDDAYDTNDDDNLNLLDIFVVLDSLFAMAAVPPAPFSACGFDEVTSGVLGCSSFTVCP